MMRWFKKQMLQILRRGTQGATVVLIFSLVYISLYAHFYATRAIQDPTQLRGFQGAVLKTIDKQVRRFNDPHSSHSRLQAFLDGNKGTLWSMRVMGVDWTDPLAALEMTVTSHTWHWPFLGSIAIPVLLALLCGKVFCSWMCPAGLMFEWADKIRNVLRFLELPLPEIRFSHRNKYALLVMGLGISSLLGLPLFALIYPPAVTSRIAHALVYGSIFAGMVGLLVAIMLVEIFISPRWWCRTMCPGGALYGLIGAKRLLRVHLDKKKCTGCKDCIPVCPMGINPILESTSMECDNCGVCLPVCSDDALYYQVGLPVGKKQRRKKHQAPGRKKKSLKTAAMLSVLLGGWLLNPATARAHHILGIPHYAYKEDYPQVPFLEYPATSGPWDIIMTTYPGRPVPGEAVNITFYVKRKDTGETYAHAVEIQAIQQHAFGRTTVVEANTRVEPDEVDRTHKLTVTFPENGHYIVLLAIEIEGQTEKIPFQIIAGNPTSTTTILLLTGGGMLVFFVIVRAIRIKRNRKKMAVSSVDTQDAPTPASTP